MIKRIIIIILAVFLLVILTIVTINTFKNNPLFISRYLKSQINQTQKAYFKNYKDWLWDTEREFVFDVVYMNVFSPGTAKMLIKESTKVKEAPAFILEASLEPNNFFKRIYDAKMTLKAAVEKDSKLSLWYREESFTPEKTSSKEINFDIKDKIATRGDVKIRIPDKTYDPLSVFFNFLNNEFKIGEPIILNLLSKEDIYEFKVIPKEVKNDIYKLEGEVYRKNRSSTHGARFTIWVLDGKVRVPLIVKVVSAGGPVYLRLKTVK